MRIIKSTDHKPYELVFPSKRMIDLRLLTKLKTKPFPPFVERPQERQSTSQRRRRTAAASTRIFTAQLDHLQRGSCHRPRGNAAVPRT